MPDKDGFDIDVQNGDLIVRAPRTLDAATQPAFAQTLNDIKDSTTSKVCIDLSATEFLDSAGVGFLVKIHRLCEAGLGAIEIKGATEQPLKLLQSLEVDKHINLID